MKCMPSCFPFKFHRFRRNRRNTYNYLQKEALKELSHDSFENDNIFWNNFVENNHANSELSNKMIYDIYNHDPMFPNARPTNFSHAQKKLHTKTNLSSIENPRKPINITLKSFNSPHSYENIQKYALSYPYAGNSSLEQKDSTPNSHSIDSESETEDVIVKPRKTDRNNLNSPK